MRTTLTLLLSIFCCCIHAQYCGILYVDANAAGANTGTSWADAYTDLQDAIDAASPGGQIWVATGSYLPTKDQLGNPAPSFGRDKTFFINKDIQLYGGFAGAEQQLSQRDAAANPTILSGDLGAAGMAADNAYRVLWLSAVSPACVLDGFTIAHGNGSQGGGMFLQQQPGQYAAPTIRNCIFENNNATSGGGLHSQSTEWAGPPIRIESCIFRNNTASSGAGIYLAQGAATAISLEMASLEFIDNNCSGHGGGLYAQGFFRASNCRFESNEANRGAGANIEGGNAAFDGCSFISNTSLRNGGGLRMEGAIAKLANCRFMGNEANILNEPSTTTDAGGGLFYRGSSSAYARLANCVFSGNKGENGAAFAQASGFLSTASSELDNCSFAGNDGLSAVARLGGSLTLDNSIVYGNAGTQLTGGTARNCIVQGGYAGAGNLNVDPQFVNLPIFNLAPIAAGNLQLQPNSPAIGQGDNSLAPLEVTTDAAGNHRLVNCQVDIGAFEFGNPAPSDIVCYADADGDGLGDPFAPRLSCSACPAGFVLNDNDCDGGNAAVATSLPAPAAIRPAAEFCRGEPDAALRTVSAEALGRYTWVLVQAPAGSSFAGMAPLSFSPGQVNTEFSIGLSQVVMCDAPTNQGAPVYGTWVFEAYYETAGGCESAVAQGFTATVNEGGAQGLIAAGDSRLCPGEAAVLFFEATAGEGPFDIVVNGQSYTGLSDGSPFDTLVAGVDFTDSLRLELSQVGDGSSCENGGGAVQELLLYVSSGISGAEILHNDISCAGLNDGEALVIPQGGTPPYQYLWDNGQTTESAGGLAAGAHAVTITDANGCMLTEAITVTEPPALELEVVSVLPAGCSEPEGQATVQATGGNGVYVYQWSDGQSGTHAVGLAPGAYSVTVADDNGCQATASISIEGTEPLVLEEPGLQHPACSNSADGQIELAVSGGLPPYHYSWADGQEGPIATGLSAGLHTATITDAVGCVLLDSFTLQASYQLLIGINMLGSVRCRGDSTAALRAVPVGGLAPFSFLWNTGQTTAEISGLPAGSYAVTITDANGCSVSGGALAQDPPFLEVQLDAMPPSCANSGDGRIVAVGSGGTPPYAYHWSDGQVGQSFVVETAGTFTVTLTDANQCTVVSGLSVELPAGLEGAVASIGTATCQEAEDGSAEVEAAGGTPPYSFLWGNGQSGPEAFGLAPGDYLATISDANGCQVELELTVPAGAYEPDLGIDREGEVLTVLETGAEYQWIDCQTGEELSGANEQFFIPAVSGEYAVVVTDSPSGCRATSECVEVMVVATEEANELRQQATAFPNPNSGQFTLALPWAAAALLYDASGRLLRRDNYRPGSHQVAMSELPAGVYVLALKGVDGAQVLRLIKLDEGFSQFLE